VLIFNTGDELAKGLKDFATEQNVTDASFKAIDALASVRLAWFNPQKKEYQTSVELKEQLELFSLIGDVAQHDLRPIVHAHVVVSRSDGTTAGGHLLEASVRPTCEVFLTESPVELCKAFDPDSGLGLINCRQTISTLRSPRSRIPAPRRCPRGIDFSDDLAH
jgi:predicted DNA-binding protein with PD1-like motif